ncbi:MAG: S-layer homology domain-containing protein [Clostridia bacterium]|nr:S-layer homology domain-containing protein [Clostridia bacterium]
MKTGPVKLAVMVMISLFFFNSNSFAHGLIYETKPVEGNKLRITLKWSNPEDAKPVSISYFHLKNGKALTIGYSVNQGTSTTTSMDFDLSGSIPPIRILLNRVGDKENLIFKDIQNMDVKEHIQHLHDAGIVNGRDGELFKPFDSITRAEFMVLMVKALKLEGTAQNEKGFKDIHKHWAKNTVLLAVKHGLISGYKDNTIKPDNPITVGEVCAVISRAFTFKSVKSGIYDKLKRDQWYSGFVKQIFDAEILKTSDNIYREFNEGNYINRADCAMMVSRALSTY